MTRRIRMVALAIALGAMALPAVASAGVEIRSVDASSYPRTVATVVTSKPTRVPPELTEAGKPATGLIAQNLAADKSIVLLVDNSRSMKGKSLKNALAAAQAFVRDKALNDKVGVIAFASEASVVTDLSASGGVAQQALGGITVDSHPGTALYDAIVLGAEQLRQETGGKVILLVTDGKDFSSRADFPAAVDAAHGAGALVYAIGIKGRQFSPGTLRSLTQKTGGGYRTATSSNLTDVYGAVAAELRNTWRLDYITSARPGESPKVVARVAGLGSGSARLVVPPTAKLATPGGLLPVAAYGSGGSAGLALLVGLLILVAVLLFFSSANADWLRSKIEKHLYAKPKARAKKGKKERLQSLAGLFQMTEQALGRTRPWMRLGKLIERADLALKTAELFYMMLASFVVFGIFAVIVGASALVALILLVIGALLPVGFVWMKGRRRIQAFENQLPDLLIGVAASLKAGHSFKQGLQAIVDEGVEPAGKEFKRVLTETRLGRPLDDALQDMADRVGSKNLSFIVTAVAVQTQVGGSLASLFDMVADTVRNRQQFARKIKALTAMGRMSAYVLIGLPFFLAGALTLMNPSYMAPLFETSSGHKMILVSLTMMVVGSLLLKKIVSFKG
jgi:tight adherence protein B